MLVTRNLGFHCHGLDHFDQAIIDHGLQRGEFYNFPPEELPELHRRVTQHNLASSVHAPLKRLSWYPSPPTFTFLCEAEPERRSLSLRMIEETMEQAQDLGADHVVVHFPSPGSSNGPDPRSYDEALAVAWHSAELLSEMSRRYGLPIHIEGFGPSPFLEVDFLMRIMTELPGLSYCFDTGHMHLQSHAFGFDLYEFAQGMARYIGSLHLWNNRGAEDYLAYRHIPLHPSQRAEEGWGDIARILQIVLSENPSVIMIMESGLHYPEQLGGHDIAEGVQWVKGLIADIV
jgi:sugar phosphate isomerase/epimerase